MTRFAIGIAIGALCVGCGEDAPPASAPAASQEFTQSEANRAPIVESVRLDPDQPVLGASLQAVVTARDPDGQPVTLEHRWFVDGAQQHASGPSFAVAGVAKGAEIRVSVIASDGALQSDAVESSARVTDRVPQMTSALIAPEGTVSPGQPVRASAGAGDADGDPIDYEYTWFVNGERQSETAGSIFKTDGLKGGDTIYVEVRATDGTNWTDALRTAVVTVGGGHPQITSTPPGLRDDGMFRYQVTAVDPGGDRRLRYSLEKGPEGMAIDDITGELYWRPNKLVPGVHPVTVAVRNSSGLQTSQSFSVTVEEKTETVAAPAGRHIRVRKPAEGTPASPEE